MSALALTLDGFRRWRAGGCLAQIHLDPGGIMAQIVVEGLEAVSEAASYERLDLASRRLHQGAYD
ncbi:hypothetical protein [Sphingobium ummariense]|uniref:Uncharacterized protein n=1 Tax=Sphingobium ummariense RL-3 TaxID=1346791 RepID=T0KBY0_9SPHN|nr:hypothetical protein [Sphingobium ummariense]EQB34214.1 hypothetical protein M529_00950 [Sphingobium ummariense RL-3]